MLRKVAAVLCLAAFLFLASVASAEGPPKKKPPPHPPKKAPPKPPPPKAKAGLVSYKAILPASFWSVPRYQLHRGQTLEVAANLLLPNMPSAGQALELHIERDPGKFVHVATAKIGAGLNFTTLTWKVGPKFPSGAHRMFVRFPGNKHHKAMQSQALTFVVP
jgi:hypothetical protein